MPNSARNKKLLITNDNGGYSKDGTAAVEYYEDSDTPTFTKQITWTGGWMQK